MVGESQYASTFALFEAIYVLFAIESEKDYLLEGFFGLDELYLSNQADIRLYGGYDYDRTYLYNQDLRPRQLRETYLCVGDVLVLYEDADTDAYIYDGDSFVGVEESGYVFRLTEVEDLIESANGYDHYKIIRPLKAA
jgi:hypothetical protein